MIEVKSPLTFSENISLVEKISTRKIIHEYKRSKIDVEKYFKGAKYIALYKCNDSDYCFYYPFFTGDSSFYEHFQQFNWYYMPWKWEHEIASKHLKAKDKILEIGCGHGEFLERINITHELDLSIGLELNQNALASNEIYEIKNATIESFAGEHKGEFDVVCGFQVLEHIPECRSFISSSINCLKPGGLLIISVPNNDTYLKNLNAYLNMPPHHLGLWNEKSLRHISNIFPVKVKSVFIEPLQTYHIGNYIQSKYYSKYPYYFMKIIRKMHKLLGVYEKMEMEIRSSLDSIPGHTIMIVLEKT